jgi:serine protease Do
MSDHKKNSLPVLLGLVTIGVIFGIVLTTGFNLDTKAAADTSDKIYTESASDTPTANTSNINPNNMFVDIVKKVRPSIVSIYTTKSVKIPKDNPFYYFFKQQHGTDELPPQEGLGSGIIISKDGYILTNNHVVSGVDELTVKMIDKSEYKAKLIGTDPTTEVALIKIDADNLPAVVLGNSDNVQIGEWVLAIGSPLNLTSTVTAGIVSALSRDVNIIRSKNNLSGIEDFIQTDAAINPGNSGGALLNTRGEVIGINTAIASGTSYYVGYGFAVPINIAKSVVDDLLKYGEVKRGYLGVYIEDMDPVKTKGVGLDKIRGVFISSVIPDGAADKAGIKAGDVVLSVNGKEVNKRNELQAKIGTYNPGDKVNLQIWRDGKKITIEAVLQSRSGETTITKKSAQEEESKASLDLGMKVEGLNDRQLDELELDNGVVVAAVERRSAAEEAGLSRGDVIYEVANKEIESVSDFYDAFSGYKAGDVVKIKVRRKMRGDIFDRLVFIQIPEQEK